MDTGGLSAGFKHYLILNGAIVTLVVVSFLLLRRSRKGPVQLDLRDENQIASDNAREAKVVPEKPPPKFSDPRQKKPLGAENYQPRARRPQIEVLDPEGEARSLNALFNWNGHTWDAYEVLGLPGGSSRASAETAYARAAALADQETLPFLQAALAVIPKA